MKELAITFCRCLSECISSSLTKRQIVKSKIQLSFKKHCNCPCTGKGKLIWFSFGRCGQRFTAGIAKRSVQCHVVFAHSPPDRSLNAKHPVNTSHRFDLCKNVSLQCYLVATVIHIQSVHVCVYIHIVHNIGTLVGWK